MMNKKNITSVLGVIGLAGVVGAGSLSAQDATPPAPPATPPAPAPAVPPAPKLSDAEVKEISSFFLGYRSSQQFAGSGLQTGDVSTDAFVKGFLAGLKGDKPGYPEDKLRAAMEALGKLVQEREIEKGKKNLAAGNEFLAKNAKREGVTTTASGMQYEVINKGTDKKYVAPANGAADTGTQFVIKYRGTLIDGSEFDKSPEGETFDMPINRCISGFREALTLMPVGAKWKIYLPSNLAYGPRSMGPKIGANSALIFELELVDIKAAPPAPPAVPAPPVPAQPTQPDRPKASATTPPVQVPASKQ